ncbi:MAG: VCBS repeat-containing protein, partial [Gemmatimonadetes bacterium]|nr:VCBS repeat-containing protein [Gemmatimonadota bacterium]
MSTSCRLPGVLCALFFMSASPSFGAVTLYIDDAAGWEAALASATLSSDTVLTTAANIALSDEVASPPGANSGIGPTLTFDRANTGLDFDFVLTAPNAVAGFEQWSLVFDDNEGGIPPNWISVGDIDGVGGEPSTTVPYQDDDFEMTLSVDGFRVYGFGFILGNNTGEAGEVLSVYGVGDTLIQSFDMSTVGNPVGWVGNFVGIISDDPITRIFYDEGGIGGDDVGIKDLRFGSSAPFVDIGAGLTGVNVSSVVWGDYDNDGDLDILLAGQDSGGRVAKVYQNTAGTFTDIGAGLTGVSVPSVVWGDYDNDGDLDILLTGRDSGIFIPVAKVYENSGGTFTDIGAFLTGVRFSSVAWGDYDNDGDL